MSFVHIPLCIHIRFWVWTLSEAYELKINEKFGVQNQISFVQLDVLDAIKVVSNFPLQFLALPPVVAPLKCSLLPLSSNAEFQPFIKQLCEFQYRILQVP